MSNSNTIQDSLDKVIKLSEALFKQNVIMLTVSEKLLEANGDLTVFKQNNHFINYAYIFTNATLDLAIITKNLDAAKYPSEERFFIRSSYLIVYEMINTYNKFQIEFRELAAKYPKMKIPLDTLNLELKEYRRKHKIDSEASKIRNKTIAHLDKNAIEYHRLTESFDKKSTIIMSMEFLKIMRNITPILQKFHEDQKEEIENERLKGKDRFLAFINRKEE
ncbi:hypothetical protein [Kordia sp.]|uniref:hypothetical protein n=1 Tax=Kordia sp. TaxID=1965332 RepID=UPI003B595BCC